ncbi:hypothetical protein AKG16_18485 [Morganella morganii]|nr:hypothetical protein AKG16_18485 [Morganella morganii]
MHYAIVPVTHRKGVSVTGAMAAVAGNTTGRMDTVAAASIMVTTNVVLTVNIAAIAAMVTTMDTANITNTAVTVLIMSITDTVATKSVNTVVTAAAEKVCAVCLITVICAS